ncbi:hypothetical protein EZV73_13430 [Acidaminobacter sp. JC074]|uniref:hypothetical protein n=1 Tax=Acidaminobacter sp. JC074 TaxID=2530199 RepID=UPI001F108325|nr:hypothetical protein [Acidaminobacter sp. JC074]MCH4888588.1 hypothetical protein [Acidaminobacter sp. JC074]
MKKLSHNRIIDYFPTIKMNASEPFEMLGIGYTVFEESKRSPSFDRRIQVDLDTSMVIEYALYWNYDIEHLYDLEHIWLYLDHSYQVVKCEVSFHGQVINGLTLNNYDDNGLFLYCQAGKHALAPSLDVYENWHNYRSCTSETVGKDGFLVTPILENIMSTNHEIDEKVKWYMQKFKFKLSETYHAVDIPEVLFMPWTYLQHEIPLLIKEELAIIDYHLMMRKEVVCV